MTLSDLTTALANGGIECARHEAKLLFSRFGDVSPAALLVGNPTCTSPALDDALARRLRGEPLQYILGEVGFFHETYRVTPACLIPRADTELLVEYATETLPRGAHFADLCTGSGCIAISTLAARTDLTADAYDISEDALTLAKENAVHNGVAERLNFQKRDLLLYGIDGMFDAILSNPPYIVREVIDGLAPELTYEPRIALDGGEDGLDFYRAILHHNLPHLAPDGMILFEIGYDQEEAIKELATAREMTCEVKRDLGGNPRLAILKRKN